MACLAISRGRDRSLDRMICARRVVHDEIDAGGHLEGADVAARASDDPPLRSSLGRSTTTPWVSTACRRRSAEWPG